MGRIRNLIDGFWTAIQNHETEARAKMKREGGSERERRPRWYANAALRDSTYREAELRRCLDLQHELDQKWFSTLAVVKSAIEKEMESIPVDSPLIIESGGRHFALHENCLWSSTRSLTVQQWTGLISQQLSREQARLDSLSTPTPASVNRRLAIASSVRTEVWRRDGGQCVRCGSRDRLEFDHIIPVARGGSSTARNIELLCELCNRLKAASIG